MTETALEKKRLRAEVRARITSLEEVYLVRSDAGITGGVLFLPEYGAACRIFAYYSEGRECGTREIIAAALLAGKTVALPVVAGGGHMDFAEFLGSLEPGALGIHEPGGVRRILVPEPGDLMLVPALCCDGEGYRLGQGGGYYDRYLANCRAFTVCLCRERLLAEKVPRDWNDLPVEAVITEDRLIRPLRRP